MYSGGLLYSFFIHTSMSLINSGVLNNQLDPEL